ncbi:MAG: choice-of-anchor R domain-containing protein, partial [Pirellulales bacterium]
MNFVPAHSIRLVAFLSLVLAGVSANADVVFGNLGASGTGALGGTNTDFGPVDTGELALAQGFNTGTSSLLNIQSVTLGLFATNSGTNENRTVSIYSDSSGSPGSILFTSQVVGIGNSGTYTFPFSSATLSASTPYWIVPSGPASWYLNTPDSAPAGQNSSGYSYTSTLRNAPSVGWTTPSPNLNSYSVSVVAVPEPPAIVMA